MKIPLVTNIQKYSIHDGEGIRTTVFFKGCPLSCKWCHNPETQMFTREVMWNPEKCGKCESCVRICDEHAVSLKNDRIITANDICKGCGRCIEECINSARDLVGKEYSVDELTKKLKQDMMFYESSKGGVTLSGGEVMAQDLDYILDVMKKLYRVGISVNIDTCGMAPFEKFERILPYTDTFLYDIKHMNTEMHKRYTGVGNELILENLIKLQKAGAKIALRLPIIVSVNDNEEHIKELLNFLKANNIKPVSIHLLAYHTLGREKYDKLGRRLEQDGFEAPVDEILAKFAGMFEREGFMNIRIKD